MKKIEFMVRRSWLAVVIAAGCGPHPPAIVITEPASGAVVSGLVRIEAEVQAECGVRVVNFYLDDSLIGHFDAEPYSAVWNTFRWPDSTAHKIHARVADVAGQEDVSDTVAVSIGNGDLIFRDDFEVYNAGVYPAEGGWTALWPGVADSSMVDPLAGRAGSAGFRLFGSWHYVRTDGVGLDLSGVDGLTYELYVKVPSGSSNGCLAGFFITTAPDTGEILNGVQFDFNDHRVSVRGIDPYVTGYAWRNDAWYKVRVALDFSRSVMSAWINDSQVVADWPAAPKSQCDTFAVSSEYLGLGRAYFDDIEIRKVR